jgi:hypothetical protein
MSPHIDLTGGKSGPCTARAIETWLPNSAGAHKSRLCIRMVSARDGTAPGPVGRPAHRGGLPGSRADGRRTDLGEPTSKAGKPPLSSFVGFLYAAA